MWPKLTLFVVAVGVYVALCARVSDRMNASFPTCEPAREACAVLVTGGSRGIGRAIALRLGRAGYAVYAGVRKRKDGEQFDAVEGVTPVILDVSNRTNVDEVVRKLPTLYALVNNAGIGGDTVFEFDKTWENVINVDLVAQMYLARQVLPAMRRNKRGRIVHTGSIAGEAVTAGATAYSVAKTGLRVFSDGLRREVRHLGIHSSTLEPGFTDDTDMPLEVSPRMKAYAKRAKEDSDFGDYSKFFTEKAIQDFEKLCYGTMSPVSEVADDALHAIGSVRPHNVYWESGLKYLIPIFRILPSGLLDLAQ